MALTGLQQVLAQRGDALRRCGWRQKHRCCRPGLSASNWRMHGLRLRWPNQPDHIC
jgi:hypothetical protein